MRLDSSTFQRKHSILQYKENLYIERRPSFFAFAGIGFEEKRLRGIRLQIFSFTPLEGVVIL
jgi:hypothetical protein